MTTVVSWNIQAGLGVDGRVDLDRIARVIAALADADVICLQEVECPGDLASGVDQFAAIADLFSRHAAIEGLCVQRAAGREEYRFGNMVLSRLPVLSVFRHHLPWPAAPGVKHMPRQATEVTVENRRRRLAGGHHASGISRPPRTAGPRSRVFASCMPRLRRRGNTRLRRMQTAPMPARYGPPRA